MARKIGLDLAISVAAVGATTAAIAALLSRWQIPNLSLLYILVILWLAAVRGRAAALLASIEAFLFFDWFFIPPYHELDVERPLDWLALTTFLVVGLVAGQAYAAQRRQALEAADRDRHTQLLYELSTELTAAENLGSTFDRMLQALAAGLHLDGLRLYVWRNGARELSGTFGAGAAPDGSSTQVHTVPCRLGDAELAELEVLGKAGRNDLSRDDLRVLQGFANQLANALERRRLEKEEQRSQLLAEANRTKSSLLAAVSHDLRTPLAAIKASATSLLRHGSSWDEAARRESLASI
ncbi:MAG: DUF4118 domain-containing protein, partial [Chloroflexota bacterium]|nr:DUF4118 domain-containing protein [Chloroflexota bacterium]